MRRRQSQTDNRRDPRRGSVIVEFSLAFLAFITMMLATVDIGRAIWTFGALNHAVFQGARFATVHGSDNPVMNNGQNETAAAIQDIVRANTVGLDSAQVTVATTYTPNNDPGSEFTVTATYQMDTVFGTVIFATNQLGLNVQTSGIVLR